MWDLNSLYGDFNTDEFESDLNTIEKCLEIFKKDESKAKDDEIYREFYTVFNRAMTYSNLRYIARIDKSESAKYMNYLRSIYNEIRDMRNENDISIILKPSSDIFRDMYYSNRNNEFVSAYCLTGIKKNTNIIAKSKNYDDVLSMAIDKYQFTEKVFENMNISIENLIPKFHKHYRENNYYKIYNDYETEDISYEEAQSIINNTIDGFSRDAYFWVKKAFDFNWIDIDPKSEDPFCINIPSISEFRLKLKYKNDLRSLLSLSHELGHGYHGSTLYGTDILDYRYPLSIGESSALFFEELIYENLPKKYKSKEIYNLNTTLFTIDVYARYLFEKKVFENIDSNYLNPETLDGFMYDSLKYCYGNIHGLDKRLWQYKSHYYNLLRPFYNITYIYGLFIAKLIYSEYKENPVNFDRKYKEFYSRSNKVHIVENMKDSFDLDIEDYSVWKNFEKIIEKSIEE
ncbi:MAG: hypothetical protein Q4P31_02285 [Andreesenia angusta]|nr:hypothetical protein [Andreesenia angusta]